MDPGNYLLSFSRLAPVNVATHGHASTTGMPQYGTLLHSDLPSPK